MFASFFKAEKKETQTQTMNTPLSLHENIENNPENITKNEDYTKNRTKTRINIFLAKELANCHDAICTFCSDLFAILIPVSIICSIIALIIFMF